MSASDSVDIDFATFFIYWATLEGWNVPRFHLDLVQFLESWEHWDNNTAVVQIFRGAGKSTILGLFITYMLVKDPTLRFLILSADYNTAKKITRDCQSIISRHPLAEHLKGKENTWRADHFFVHGATDARNPSVAAHGIMSNITGARADFIVFDDVEVPKNCRSAQLRDDLRKRMSDTTHILIPQTGRKLLVGTPHAFESIYPEYIDKGSSSLRIPLLTKPKGEFPHIRGISTWPERFDDKTVLERQLMSKAKGEFLSQYQLLPFSVDDSVLDPALIDVYEDQIEFGVSNQTKWAKIGDRHMASVSAFWDVSLSKRSGDDSVLAIVYVSVDGHIFIHRTIELTGSVDEQCEQVKDAAIEYQVPLVTVETNGIGGFVPQILLKHVRGLGIGVDGKATTKNKGQKIIEAYETPMSGGFLHISRQVANTKFLTQLRDFRPSGMVEHDDFIDAPASAIDNEPIRIGRGSPVGKRLDFGWKGHGGSVEVAVEMTSL